jgi:glyoxylase-like metal-dependent hydrolase (beta-lactamase superfamily II)
MLVPARNPGPLTGRGNNTWLLDGAEPALIDAGIGHPEHVDAVAAALGGRPLARVLVTHGHADHASGAPALRARWPEVELHKWRLPGETGWLPLSDGQRLRAGDRELDVLHTPGHALDHVCFWDRAARELYAGDMVALGTTIVVPADRGGGMRAYLESLERMAGLDPVRIYPGHGEVIEEPRELIAEFLEHRRLRESQVLACLEAGVTDVDAMVARIYPGLDSALRPAARQTVEAHLAKLRAEGRIMIGS